MKSFTELVGITNPVNNLQKKATSIVDIFNKTIIDLEKVNKKADAHFAERQTKLEKLQGEQEALQLLKINNQKVISKISKIFE